MAVVADTKNGFDFRYKNNFKSRVWSYLRINPDLNFKGYQSKAKNYQCSESAFDEVKKDVKLWGIWDPKELCIVPKTPSALERIEALNHQNPPQETQLNPLPPIEPTPIGNALALANMGSPGGKKRRLDTELKELVRAEFRTKPTITYDELQAAVNWPEFTKTNYYQVRQEMIRMGEFEAVLLGPGRKLSGAVALARKNLMELKVDELRGMNYPRYKEKFGHHDITAPEAARAIEWALSQHSEKRKSKSPIEAPVAAMEKPAQPIVIQKAFEAEPEMPAVVKTPKNTVTIMATVDMDPTIPLQYHAAVKGMFVRYFEERFAQTGKINDSECRLMTDPVCIEIRKVTK